MWILLGSMDLFEAGILAWIHSRIRTWGFHPQTGMCTTLLGVGQGKSTRINMGHWFPECVAKAKGSGLSLGLGVGGLGVEVCSLGVTLPAAAGRNRPPPFAMRDLGGCCKSCRLWKP